MPRGIPLSRSLTLCGSPARGSPQHYARLPAADASGLWARKCRAHRARYGRKTRTDDVKPFHVTIFADNIDSTSAKRPLYSGARRASGHGLDDAGNP